MNQFLQEQLKIYTVQAGKLKQHGSDFFQSFNVNITYDENKGLTTRLNGIDEKTIKAYLVDFRPFIMNDSQINFDRITNGLIREGISCDSVKIAKQNWSKILQRKAAEVIPHMQITINDNLLKAEKQLDLFINELYFHPDQKSEQFKEILANPVIEAGFRFLIIGTIQELSKQIIGLNETVILPLIPNEK